MTDDFPHGEQRGYSRGCHCEPCRAAHAAHAAYAAAADLCLASRRLGEWMADPFFRPRHLTDVARRDLADARDRITALLGE